MTNKTECNCSLSIKLCGDGCMKCQPETYIFNLENALQTAEQEIEQLRSEIESLKKVPLFNRLTHKIVPIEPTIEWQTNIADIQDCVSYETIKNVIAAAPEYQDIEQTPVAIIGNDFQLLYAQIGSISEIVKLHELGVGTLLYAMPPAPEGDKP